LIKLIGGYTFLASSAFLAITIILVLVKMPETKGRTPQEIQDDFN